MSRFIIRQIYCKKKNVRREMARWLRALTALTEDPDFLLSIPCQVAHNHLLP